jgi:hypothetical protein
MYGKRWWEGPIEIGVSPVESHHNVVIVVFSFFVDEVTSMGLRQT